MWHVLSNPELWPSIYRDEVAAEIRKSELMSVIIELSAFAALDHLRRRNGLNPLTSAHPLEELAKEAADGLHGTRSDIQSQ